MANTKTVQNEVEESTKKVVKEAKPKTVKIKFERTRKEQDDIWVSVNGEKYLIKRGVEVEVPESVAEVLRNREKMLEEAMAYEEQAANAIE